MSVEMTNHLPSVDHHKLRIVAEIKEAYQAGHISLETARQRMIQEVKTLKPYEIALAEQSSELLDDDECRKENIQQMIDLFQDVMDRARPDLSPDHPVMCYYRENDALRRLLLSIEDLVQYPVIKNQWYEIYDQLAEWKKHLSRKQNQLYAVLERKGFDRPTTTMWLLDDFVRDEIRSARALLDGDDEEAFIAMQGTIVADLRDLMDKEETILLPTSLVMISESEFEEMKSGDLEIGFALIEGPGGSHRDYKRGDDHSEKYGANTDFMKDLAQLLTRYGVGQSAMDTDKLEVSTGQLSLDQINLIFRHLPIDISFVDEDELVRFYSDTDHRIFPRSKNVIGRKVANCHPRTSVHIVEEIISKFRSGEQDSVEFWINKPELFVYIYYVAVRDDQGHFRGVLEMMQDCTRIRVLQDSRTLLTWTESTAGAVKGATADSDMSAVYEAGGDADHAELNHADSSPAITAVKPTTRLQDLLKQYPHLKAELPKVHDAFKMLSTPLARIMLPKATVQMMADRSGMDLNLLIAHIERIIKG